MHQYFCAKIQKSFVVTKFFRTFAPAFGVTDGGKIGELPAMLRWNDTTI
jgi:hypothetical protein